MQYFNCFHLILGDISKVYKQCPLAAKFADSVDLKDRLLNNRDWTVKFLVVESYFSCNTTHTV